MWDMRNRHSSGNKHGPIIMKFNILKYEKEENREEG